MILSHTYNGEFTAEFTAYTERVPLETTEGPSQWEDQIIQVECVAVIIAGQRFDELDFQRNPDIWEPIVQSLETEVTEADFE